MAESLWATIALITVTASLPLYLYGAWYILNREPVTWAVLVHHLWAVGSGLLLTTVPVVTWMLPRFPQQLGGAAVLHAFVGLQAYALLTFALTGIVRIFQVKVAHDRYEHPEGDVPLDDLHEKMPDWRRRLRVGVAGYVILWLIAWTIGVARYVTSYVI